MTEVFDLDTVTRLNRRIRQVCREKGYSYKDYRKEVYVLMNIPEVHTVWVRRRKINRLLKLYGKADQRTDAWLQKRGEMITASEVCKAFASASPSARKEMLVRKVNPKESAGQGPSMTACLWGTQFEPLAKEIYANLQGGANVVDTTCVVHPKYPFLGASPDGIVLMKNPLDRDWGKLVEFKCPISRKFTQDTAIPDAYYHQMQMQMECTGIDMCDYCEMQFVRCNQTDWKESTSPYKGVLAVYDSGEIVYKPQETDIKSTGLSKTFELSKSRKTPRGWTRTLLTSKRSGRLFKNAATTPLKWSSMSKKLTHSMTRRRPSRWRLRSRRSRTR